MAKGVPIQGRNPSGNAQIANVTAEGDLKVQLSGTMDNKKRINKLLDLIGLDNLAYFLTFHEEDGKFRDLIDKNIVFKGYVGGDRYYRVAGGPLGYYISNEGKPSEVLVLDSDMSFWGGTSTPTVAKKYATKLSYASGYIGSVATMIKKIGDVSPVKFILYTDDNGKPGDPLEQYDEIFINGRQDPTRSVAAEEYREVSTPLITGFGLTLGTDYWLVMEYEDDTNINGSNYVQWRYGEDANGARASWDGEKWIVTQGESFNYKLFPEKIQIPNDFTISALVKTSLDTPEQPIIAMVDTEGYVLRLRFCYGTLNVITPSVSDHNYKPLYPLDDWSVITVTFNQHAFVDKIKVYQNGVLIDGVTWEVNPTGSKVRRGIRGPGGVGLARVGQVTLGRIWSFAGNTSGTSLQNLGPLFVAKRTFNDKEVAETARLMLGGAI